MKQRSTLLRFATAALIAGAILIGLPAGAAVVRKAPAARPAYVPGEVVVKYRASATPTQVDRSLQALAGRRGRTTGDLRLPRMIRLKAGAGVPAAVRALRADPAVEYAEPNYHRYARSRTVPNDPSFPDQWDWDNTGLVPPAVNDADMDMPEAWSIIHDATDVTVAIIDDGFALDQPDLQGNLDASGGIDCSGTACTAGTTAARDPDADPAEDHGTWVAGVVGATGNNATEIAGAAWKVHLLPIKTDLTSASLAAAIHYAVDHSATIINISLGGPGFSQAEFDALDYARQHGVLVVTSAGNEDSNTDLAKVSFPANYDLPNIIAAAASDSQDDIAFFSTWGSFTVDVAAPGEDVPTTDAGGGIQTVSGTSFSSPATAGVAALVAQHLKDLTGTMPGYREIKAHLFAGAEIAGATGDSGIEGRVATGRVNAYNALQPVSGGVFVIHGVTVDDDPSLSAGNNGDKEIDPGEAVMLEVTLENVWQDEADVTGTLIARNDFSVAGATEEDFGPVAKSLPDNKNGLATAAFPVTIGDFTGNQHLLFELDVDAASGSQQKRYFYLNVGHLDAGVTLTQQMQRTNWDEFQNFHIDVPAGARDLVFFTHTDNDVDIDLLARHGQLPEYNITLGQAMDSDTYNFYTDPDTTVSGNINGEETISVPDPDAGTWNLVAVNFADFVHSYQIGACYAPAGSDQISFVGNVQVPEDGTTATLSVVRSGTAGAASIDYASQDGSATAVNNYTPVAGTLHWADGDAATQTISVPITNSGTIAKGGSRSFQVVLSNPQVAGAGCLDTAEVILIAGDHPVDNPPTAEPPPEEPPPPPSPPSPPPKKGGGGGSLGLIGLVLLLEPLVIQRARRRRRAH